MPEQVFATARSAENGQDGALFTVAAFAGLRLGELRALRWDDVDFARGRITVRRNLPDGTTGEGTTKSGKVRHVEMIPFAATALDGVNRREEFTGPADHVFVGVTGAPLDSSKLRRRFKTALGSAGVDRDGFPAGPLRLYDPRHTFGRSARRLGSRARCRHTWATRTSRRR